MPEPPDDEVYDLIGAIGAGINAAENEELPPELREMADNLSADLRDQTS
ncbi:MULTISPECIES: hypothetical protein [Streptomyces]|nr:MULTISPECIES: hypothetical protein [Streptomyces]